MSIDYSLFMLTRFCEEIKAEGADAPRRPAALRAAVRRMQAPARVREGGRMRECVRALSRACFRAETDGGTDDACCKRTAAMLRVHAHVNPPEHADCSVRLLCAGSAWLACHLRASSTRCLSA
eukprot:209228-Pleurochrysis_carterae.AAC.1